MKNIRFTGSISSLLWETLKFGFLSTISLGIAMPWLLKSYLNYIYSFVVCEGGEYLYYRDYKPTQLLFINLMYLLLGIITFGIFYISYPAKLIDYITYHTRVNKNNVTYYRVSYKSLKDYFIFGLMMIAYSLLMLVTLGFATPFVLLKLSERVSKYLSFFNKSDKENVLNISFGFRYAAGDKKNQFIKNYFINKVLLFATFGLYIGYYMYFVFNGLLQFVSVYDSN